MTDYKVKRLIIITLPCYFGWLLSFAFYGPIMVGAEKHYGLNGNVLVALFTLCHCLGFIMGSMLGKKKDQWYRFMYISALITLVSHLLMLIPSSFIWYFGMVVSGVCSAFYILGWSYFFSFSSEVDRRVDIMVPVIVASNLILVGMSRVENWFSFPVLWVLSSGLLVATMVILIRMPLKLKKRLSAPMASQPMPKILLGIIGLFIFSIYINGGFMYRIILPVMEEGFENPGSFQNVTYILVLVAIYKFRRKISYDLLLYLGVGLLGLAFVSFALLDKGIAGFFMAIGLVEASFSIIDLFIWTVMSNLAFVYGSSFQFFGIAMAATTGSILVGDLIGDRLLHIGANHRLITALLASASIFIALIVMPWLSRFIESKMMWMNKEKDSKQEDGEPQDVFITQFLSIGDELTDRQMEITRLVLKGMTNKEIAEQLFISENTVKTHIKNVCNKFGVTKKRDLIHLATREE